jgi:hypothetical protein
MANKTVPTDKSVEKFIDKVQDKRKREDSRTIMELMQRVTEEPPQMWGSSIVGFGSYHYRYESGREGDMPLVGFSPRVQNLTLYIMDGFDAYDSLLEKLGKYKTGKSCLYIKRLDDVDMDVLERLVSDSVEHMRRTNPT